MIENTNINLYSFLEQAAKCEGSELSQLVFRLCIDILAATNYGCKLSFLMDKVVPFPEQVLSYIEQESHQESDADLSQKRLVAKVGRRLRRRADLDKLTRTEVLNEIDNYLYEIRMINPYLQQSDKDFLMSQHAHFLSYVINWSRKYDTLWLRQHVNTMKQHCIERLKDCKPNKAQQAVFDGFLSLNPDNIDLSFFERLKNYLSLLMRNVTWSGLFIAYLACLVSGVSVAIILTHSTNIVGPILACMLIGLTLGALITKASDIHSVSYSKKYERFTGIFTLMKDIYSSKESCIYEDLKEWQPIDQSPLPSKEALQEQIDMLEAKEQLSCTEEFVHDFLKERHSSLLSNNGFFKATPSKQAVMAPDDVNDVNNHGINVRNCTVEEFSGFLTDLLTSV